MASLRNGDMKCTSPLYHRKPSIHSSREMSWPVSWRWFFSEKRIVYKIHGGPMAGRINYQTASYQCIRPGELWQCNWLEGPSPFLLSNLHPFYLIFSHIPQKLAQSALSSMTSLTRRSRRSWLSAKATGNVPKKLMVINATRPISSAGEAWRRLENRQIGLCWMSKLTFLRLLRGKATLCRLIRRRRRYDGMSGVDRWCWFRC